MSHVAWRRFAAYTPPSRDVGPAKRAPHGGPSRTNRDCPSRISAATCSRRETTRATTRWCPRHRRPLSTKESHAQVRLGRVLRRLDSPKPWAGIKHRRPGSLACARRLAASPSIAPRISRRDLDQKDTPMGRGVLFRLSAPGPGYPSSKSSGLRVRGSGRREPPQGFRGEATPLNMEFRRDQPAAAEP
jgi:hypothetical protein